MRLTGLLWGIVTTLCVFWGQVAPDTPLITLRVVDPDGRPIPQAHVCLEATVQGEDIRKVLTTPAWQRVSPRGLCVIDGQFEHRLIADAITQGKRTVRMTALVAAPGYRPVALTHNGKLPREATVALQPARMVELRLYDWENRPVEPQRERRYMMPRSEDSPVLVLSEPGNPLYDRRALEDGSPSPASNEVFMLYEKFGIERVEAGRYRIALPEKLDGTAYLVVNAPGLIRGYLRPLSAEELQSDVIEVRLPRPTAVEFAVDFQSPAAREASRAVLYLRPLGNPTAERLRFWWGRLISDDTPTVTPEQPRYLLPNLAPGAWEVSAWLTKGDWEDVDRATVRFDAREDTPVKVAIKLEPFDPKQYQGNRTLTLKVQRAGGKPLANAPYRLELNLWRRGKRATVAQGKLDANGAARLSNLYELPQGAEEEVNYILYVNDQRLTYFALRAGDGQRELALTLPPRPGEPAPNITVVDLSTGKPVALQSLRGKWVYLEFWATWCGPCQTAMQALKQAVDTHGARWRGKLEILAVSVDDTREVVMPHLKQRGWDKFARHAWDAGQKAASLYGVEGIPTAFLIDPAGKVVWTGHPLGEDPGEKINRYLQGGRKR